MENSVKFLILVFLISNMSCKKDSTILKNRESQSISEFNCLYKAVDKPITKIEVEKFIYGEWQLYGLVVMLPNNSLPDIKIIVSNIPASPSEKPLIEIFENGKSKGKVIFDLEEIKDGNYSNVTIKSESRTLAMDYYNFIKGNIRICEKELMIDNGMAFDAPAYLFRKVD